MKKFGNVKIKYLSILGMGKTTCENNVTETHGKELV